MVNIRLKRALEQCVAGGRCRFITYGEFGKRFGFGPRGPGKKLLDPVAREFKKRKGLDLTYLLRNARYRYPSQIGGKPSKPPSRQQKLRARAVARKIINKYCPGASSPY
jgi:hypothetical protein